MSEILIRGMEMPKNDNDFLKLVIFNDGRCFVAVGENDVTSKTGVVTAQEVPPHERLIDAGALFKAMFKCQDGSIIGDKGIDGWPHEATYAEIKRFIRHAPTIIPASE